jgi:hypothetical protein
MGGIITKYISRRSAPTAILTISVIAAAASALAPTTAIGGEAQQIIPDIIISSAIPANGDLNPYGVAFVPPGFPSGAPLKFVLVGNVPTDSSGTIQQGSLQVIDRKGTLVTTFTDQLKLTDPWDLTIVDNFHHATRQG